jgi:hypothetical protein
MHFNTKNIYDFFILLFFIFFQPIICPGTIPNDEDVISSLRKSIVKKSVKFFDKNNSSSTPFSESQKKLDQNNELTIDLKNPSFRNGILTTHEGGVIKNKNIRIQGKTIQYIKREEKGKLVNKIEAEGDLLIQFKNKVFVGDELEYDFITNTGTIWNGKTYSSPFYLGGEKIILNEDGTYRVKNVSATTCENINSTWDIYASNVNVKHQQFLTAKNVKFRLFNIPTLYLPYFKTNLKKFLKTPFFKYKLNWDKGAGPRISLRYQLYSWKEISLFSRFDYRLKKGFGGAIELEHLPKHGRVKFLSQNYLATDILPNDPKRKRRYRVQGEFRKTTDCKKTTLDVTWDKYTDINMPGDFKSDDFEINTAKKSIFELRHESNSNIFLIDARPRLNGFNTIKQDLPTITSNFKTLKIPKINVFSDTSLKASFLEYAYSDDLSTSLKDIHALRFEVFEKIYKNLFLGPISITPDIGVKGIYYNDCDGRSKFLGSLSYGGLFETKFYKKYNLYKHVVTPYTKYTGFSKPTTDIENEFIFSIKDGFHKLNMISLGLKNQLFSLSNDIMAPSFMCDLFTNLFVFDKSYGKILPKIYLNFEWNSPSYIINFENVYNVKQNKIDQSNFLIGYTYNENLAFKFEFRHRSKYFWRKANYNNFIIDVSKKEDELLLSPMSDRRNTILTKMYFRINPTWSCQVQSRHGFDRLTQPPYNEVKVDLFTLLSSSWQVRLSYQHSQTDDRFTGDITLLRK